MNSQLGGIVPTPPEKTGTYTSYVEGPRWANFPNYIKNLCHMLDLKIVVMDIDKGFIKETVRFKIEGVESALNDFKNQMVKDVNDWNSDDK